MNFSTRIYWAILASFWLTFTLIYAMEFAQKDLIKATVAAYVIAAVMILIGWLADWVVCRLDALWDRWRGNSLPRLKED